MTSQYAMPSGMDDPLGLAIEVAAAAVLLVTLRALGAAFEAALHYSKERKAFGRALRMAIAPDPRAAGVIPSTKGTL